MIDKELSETIGKNIKMCLGFDHVTQKELAQFLEYKNHKIISYFVSATRTPNLEQLIKIARFLNVSIDFLCGLTKKPEPTECTDYLQAAIDAYGTDNQTDVAIEEMAELTQALIHNRRGRPANIAEEIADVEIMLEQLKIIHCCADEVETQKDAKIKRLAFNLQSKEE